MEIEKAIAEIEGKMKKKIEGDDLQKNIEPNILKSFGARFDDIEKSIGVKIADIEKALTSKYDGEIADVQTLIKSIQEEVKKIGDTPLGMKSIFHGKANFFEKSVGDNIADQTDPVELSITRDKDELLKGMQDMLDGEKDEDIRQMLSDGISDYTVNTVPTSHGIRALAHLSRKKNITLGQ
jgi:copper chaperone CopZ